MGLVTGLLGRTGTADAGPRLHQALGRRQVVRVGIAPATKQVRLRDGDLRDAGGGRDRDAEVERPTDSHGIPP